MATTPTQIRIDASIKQEASALFSRLGLDMSSAVNMFLYQCVLRGGLPFAVEMPAYSQKTLDAMAKAAVFPAILTSKDIPVWKI